MSGFFESDLFIYGILTVAIVVLFISMWSSIFDSHIAGLFRLLEHIRKMMFRNSISRVLIGSLILINTSLLLLGFLYFDSKTTQLEKELANVTAQQVVNESHRIQQLAWNNQQNHALENMVSRDLLTSALIRTFQDHWDDQHNRFGYNEITKAIGVHVLDYHSDYLR